MFDNSELTLKQLPSGAFLGCGDNVMTIGWGYLGFMWRKPVFIAPVRLSRYTKELLDKVKEFSVSVSEAGKLKDELKLAGTKSGRDVDKLAAIAHTRSQKINAPLIKDCENYYECKVLASVPLSVDCLDESVKEFYSDGDIHVLFIGEILN